ncbi:MAG TPA: TIGR00341 family protein, partial [bacterium]|nr:TIGR00341 family protein [bacterium]
MELRLIEVILPREEIQALEEFLEQEYSLGIWTDFLGEQHALVRILTSTGQTESITDRLTTRYEHTEGFRLMLFPIEATIPVPEEITEEAEEQAETEEKKEKQPERISREELYQDVASG